MVNGLCPNCEKRKAAHGHVCCDKCLEQKRLLMSGKFAATVKLGGLCAICQQQVSTVRDHDHHTGLVRKGLCRACNLGLGMFHENPELMEKAANYIREHR